MKHSHSGKWEDQAWLVAVAAADRSGDLAPLIARLRSDAPLSENARELVADLLARHQLKKRQGGRARPAYEGASDEQVRVIAAAQDYDERGRRPGESEDDALERLAREYKCDAQQIRDFRSNRGGTARKYHRLREP
jgi:hypothetical protein